MKLKNDIQNSNANYSEQLRRYYTNEMSNAERHALEKEAMVDPFLKDAMEGFDADPESFEKFYKRNESKLTGKRNFTLLIALAGLAILFLVTTYIQLNNRPSEDLVANNEVNKTDTINDVLPHIETIEETEAINELEVLPTEIENLETIPVEEAITIEEVKVNQQRGVENEQPIVIDEDINIDQDYVLQNENLDLYNKTNALKAIYLFDLMVVDYREIERKNNSISYSRFELSGVSANMENDSTGTDLVERQVEIPYHNYLSKSMSFFAESRFKQALSRYLVILEQYPGDLNALFYGGLCYYNLGKFQKSILFFDQIFEEQLGNFEEEALWYKAKSLIKLKSYSEAKIILDKIIVKGGFYTEDAITLRKTLK